MHFESVFSCLCPHLSFLTAGFFWGPAGPYLLLYSLPSILSPRRPVFTAWAAGHRLGPDPLLTPRDSHCSFRTPSRGGRCLGPLCFQHALYPFLPETLLSPRPVQALCWGRGQALHFTPGAPAWRSARAWTLGRAACGGIRAHGGDPELEPRPAKSMRALGSTGRGWWGGDVGASCKGPDGRHELRWSGDVGASRKGPRAAGASSGGVGTWELPAKGEGGRCELQRPSQGSWMPS